MVQGSKCFTPKRRLVRTTGSSTTLWPVGRLISTGFFTSGLMEPRRTFKPDILKIRCNCAKLARYDGLRLWFSGMMSRLRASGQIFSIEAMVACTASGSMGSVRLFQPLGNKLVSTGASLKPELRRSMEA